MHYRRPAQPGGPPGTDDPFKGGEPGWRGRKYHGATATETVKNRGESLEPVARDILGADDQSGTA
jgi:hypothetical protein